MDGKKGKGSTGDVCILVSKYSQKCIISFQRTGGKRRLIHLLLLLVCNQVIDLRSESDPSAKQLSLTSVAFCLSSLILHIRHSFQTTHVPRSYLSRLCCFNTRRFTYLWSLSARYAPKNTPSITRKGTWINTKWSYLCVWWAWLRWVIRDAEKEREQREYIAMRLSLETIN